MLHKLAKICAQMHCDIHGQTNTRVRSNDGGRTVANGHDPQEMPLSMGGLMVNIGTIRTLGRESNGNSGG